MITYKEILQSITSISTYFKATVFLGFIFLISKVIALMIDAPIQMVSLFVAILIVIIGTYLATSPLFIDYKQFIGNLAETVRNTQAELKKEQANSKELEADLKSLEAIYESQLANSKQMVKEISDLRIRQSNLLNDLSDLQAGEQKELAMYKAKVSELQDLLSKVQSENNQNAVRVAKLKPMESYLFLHQLGLTPQQVKKGLANTINGLMNGKTEAEKENIRNIFNS